MFDEECLVKLESNSRFSSLILVDDGSGDHIWKICEFVKSSIEVEAVSQ